MRGGWIKVDYADVGYSISSRGEEAPRWWPIEGEIAVSRDPGMDRWGTTRDGTFVACILDTAFGDRHTAIEILIRGRSRAEVVARLHDLGCHSIRLKGNHRRVPDEYEAEVLASDHEVLWRPFAGREPWQPWPGN